MACQQNGIALLPEELKLPSFEDAGEMDLENILPGYFGEYRAAVPMVNSTTGGPRGSRRISTFRLRDPPLLAAFLPVLAPLEKVPFDHRLRVMDATVIRLWEPVAEEHEAVRKVHTAGHISILSPSVHVRCIRVLSRGGFIIRDKVVE
ncbi:hypothetical protein CF326_g5508 [Tilletia indica]|nr:hypothetical protein CF326_g5508 [Tilletia indica]